MTRARCRCGLFYRSEAGCQGCDEHRRRCARTLAGYREMHPSRHRELLLEGIRYSVRHRGTQLRQQAELARAGRSARQAARRSALDWELVKRMRARLTTWKSIAQRLRVPKTTLIGWARVELTHEEMEPMIAPGTRVIIRGTGRRYTTIACNCLDCATGRRVAVDEYPGLKYPAVFPGRGAWPTHYVSRAVAVDQAEATERHAEELQIGTAR